MYLKETGRGAKILWLNVGRAVVYSELGNEPSG
jgi:hypothetical protein